MTTIRLLFTSSLFALFAACGSSEEPGVLDATLTIGNDSSYAFLNIYLSPVDSDSWGPDLLGADLLLPGEVVEVSGIDCDYYDIQIIDEDGDACVLGGVDLCLDDSYWHIDDLELAACQF